ncbi:hypothetical protein FW774_17245 [Pedobacter sp. BS3]|uniref:hypothetical protein n=1 Tax=Pedobacter sp. BS3 TaxID=2567937 RepID=UPI0011EFB577|nr:hypothetical protein [Pedobacter sp. BS3]TZF81802.1 hypothetical protein FW774_17245 [Pedobacter sp. BS3]
MIHSTKKQNAMIGYLLNRLKVDSETKEELIYTYSDGRTTHISQLTGTEAAAVIQMLVNGAKLPETAASRMRRKILSLAHELGWKTTEKNAAGKYKVDIKRVNNWCKQYGYLHKPLDEYTADELPRLVTQFENMYRKHLNAM